MTDEKPATNNAHLARLLQHGVSVRCTGAADPICPKTLPPVRRTLVCPVIWQDTGADQRASHPPPNFGADKITLVGATHADQAVRALKCIAVAPVG